MKILILLTFLFSLAGCMPNPVGGSGSEGNFDSEFQPYNSSPRNFSITALTPGDASATVSWSSSQNADSYEIHYRSASVLTFTTIDNVTSPYTITGLTNSQTYLVIVTAKNERGSTNSQSLTVTPTDNIVVVPGSPVVSYATSAGKTMDFGNTMTVVPSLLNNNGASITNCTSTPALPAWATLNPNTCVISGTPTAPMAATYSIRATNAAGTSSPTSITLTVSALVPAISYLGALNTSGAIDVPMVVNPTLLNSNGSAITSCTSFPALPTWASLHPSTCVISGTPDAPLTLTSYLITATNSIGPSIGATVSLEVSAGIPVLSYAAALGTMNFVDSPMTVTPTLLKLNGSAITNCVSSPTLPTWATLDPNTCVITGTPDSTLSPTTYSIVATNSIGDSVGANVTLTAIAFNCPVGYAEVPADAALGVNRFCVMMFEARNNSGAVSEAAGTPWTNISLANAKTACTALGSDDDLISNPEWMAIARNAETVAGNWSTGSVGTGLMPRGHSDNNPSSVLTLSNTGDDYSDTLDTSGSAWEQKRKITLSNGAVIWDLSGNVSEWVDWRTTSGLQTGPTNCSASTQELASVSCAGLASNDYLPSNGSLNSSNGIGRFIGGTSGAPVRGGSWNDSDISGLYSINLGLASIAHSNVGFRCVNRPKAADAPGLSFAGATGTTVLVGEMMSILPTTLDANGAAITNCTTTPTLPSWASINPSNCEITGTPTGVMAPTSFDVVATNSVGDSNIATITLTVNGAVPVLSYVGSLGGNGAVGIPMTVSPTVLSGNTLAITNCTSSPALPAWATLNPTTCTISGTPDSFLLSTVYDISAHNSAGASVPASITLSVAAAAPVLSYSGATGVIGSVGVAMSISPTTLVDNGAAITNCTASPALPVWASINTSTCVISGTPTGILPATTYTITATNSVGSSSSNVTFRSNPSAPALSFVGSTGTTINYGSPLSVSPSLLNANGAAITSCSISPALPAWATINSSTCIISGTPTQALAATTYTVRATNSAGQSAPASVILTVNALVPTISYAGATGTTRSINSPMSVAPTTLQSNGATITNCSASPALPAWATLNPITCVISGTPNVMMATTTFTITAGNSAGTSDATVDLTVIAAVPTISYAGATGTIGSIGTAMSVSPTTLNNNGAAITNCSITPALPGWATIDPTTCVIAGTPNASLTSTTYSIIATNSTGNSTGATVTLRANAAVPTLSYVGSTGTTINYNTLANIAPTTLNTNGAAISSCTSTPSLPAWAILNPTTCAITGIATSVLPATTYTIVARNSVGYSAGATLTLQVNATPPTLSFVGSLGTSGAVGVAMSVFPTSLITNGAAVTNCTSTPTLPTWATLNPITCRITGTPDAVLPATIFNIVATNSAGDSASAAVTLTVDASAPSLSYSGATGTNGIFGALMTVAPTLISDNGSTITACTSTPALPAWATLDPVTCVITGTPNAFQAATSYSIQATNSVGNSATATVTLSVNAAPPTVSYAGATGTTVNFGTAMSVSPTTLITNGAGITNCSTTPALPTWASINPTTCVISGTPNATLTGVTYAVTATNSAGSSTAANVTLTVNAIAPNLSFAGATGTIGYVTLPMTVNPTTLNPNGSPITNCSVSPALPAWATLNTTNCVISGTPDATMSAVTYTLTATNAIGSSAGANVTLSVETVSVPELSFAGSTGTTGMVGSPMTVAPTNLDDNGSPVTSCSISPALSGGLVINNSTCIISGTPTALLAATTYTVTVTTAIGNASDTVTLTVNAGIPTLSYSGATGTTVNINTAMTVAPTLLSNNQSAITACAATPALPAWATLNPTTCVISGTANTVLPATTYSIIATNAIGNSIAASVSLTVNALVPTISYAGATGTSGSVGTAMNVVPTTLLSNGSAISNCTTSPALPAWATLNTSTCVISGTPTAPIGSTTYNITATNAIGNSTAASVSLSATSAPPLISYSGATGTTVNFGSAMTVTPTTLQNNGSTITSCNSAPALPAGLIIDPSTCVISGTATVAVSGANYSITAANSAGSSVGATVTLTVNPLAPTLSYATSAGKITNIHSVMTVTPSTLSTNGASITGCTVTPALPSWATLNTTTCVISGTPDAILSATTYSVTAVNSVGPSASASVTLQVNATAPSISYLASVVKFGDVVSIVPTLDNNGSAITNCTGAGLPAWATINTSTCEITGTPNAVAPLTVYGITVTNGIGSTSTNLSLTVTENVPTLAYAAGIKTGVYGQAITDIIPSTLLANGATVTSCTSDTALPTGLTINPTTCVISGTPTEVADNKIYKIVAHNSGGDSPEVSITIDINPGLPTLVYPSTMGKLNEAITITPTTFLSNGDTISCLAPGLPAWATIDSNTCVITGTPTAIMPLSDFTVTASNAAGSNNITLQFGVGAGKPVIGYVDLSGAVGVPYLLTPTTLNDNGGPITACLVSPSLPAWATINQNTCEISGIPNAVIGLPGATYSVVARNSGGDSEPVNITLFIDASAPQLAYASNVNGLFGDTITISPTILEENGAATTCSVAPLPATQLPLWATLDVNTCVITGTPDATFTAQISIIATNTKGSVTANFDLNISPKVPVISYSPTTYSINFGESLNITPNSIITNGSNVTACNVSPALPDGLIIDANTCIISGTPIVSQPATNHSIIATNAGGDSLAVTISIRIIPQPPSLSYVSPSNGKIGTSMTINPASLVTNGAAITACTSNPVLPAGLSIDPTTCVISGIPQVEVNGYYDITAANSGGISSAASLNLIIDPDAPQISYLNSPGLPAYLDSPAKISPTIFEDNGDLATCSISPALPIWATLDPNSCIITGSPTAVDITGTSYTVTATNNFGSTSTTFELFIQVCPTNYAEVPADLTLGTERFCVMKYEARNDGGKPSAQPNLSPWVNITVGDAKAACRSLGYDKHYDLISNAEWMAIARNIEARAANWFTGIVGGANNMLPVGHTSVVEPEDENDPYDPMILNVLSTDPYDQTTAAIVSNMQRGWEQKRTLTINTPGGTDEIWDLSGNVWEWVDWDRKTGLQKSPMCKFEEEFTDVDPNLCESGPGIATLNNEDFMPLDPGLTSDHGVGLFMGNTEPGVVSDDAFVVRGGDSAMGFVYIGNNPSAGAIDEPPTAGVYTIGMEEDALMTEDIIGFRCVFRPVEFVDP
ncbi:putative Ig domain-containing protein [Peredibacter starrii]|uniref:Ig domain-containing protein n=1 Tax=Peredibacter starrii TaxID=28202 RepID=A0AAX4HPK7_9BACT|nr:putative Ig domain-containing protein [Peredibacter starrii]WPU65056.1 putative Ig domain-containing protein [Peredibacter starrii]